MQLRDYINRIIKGESPERVRKSITASDLARLGEIIKQNSEHLPRRLRRKVQRDVTRRGIKTRTL